MYMVCPILSSYASTIYIPFFLSEILENSLIGPKFRIHRDHVVRSSNIKNVFEIIGSYKRLYDHTPSFLPQVCFRAFVSLL